MRSTLKTIMTSFLGLNEDLFFFIKRDGNVKAEGVWDEGEFDDYMSKEYYDQKINHGFKYMLPQYVKAEEVEMKNEENQAEEVKAQSQDANNQDDEKMHDETNQSLPGPTTVINRNSMSFNHQLMNY